MKKLLLSVLAVFGLASCSDFQELENSSEGNSLTTHSGVDSLDYYYWSDGVKIPLTVNKNKSFVMVETAAYKRMSRSAINIGGEKENAQIVDNYSSLSIDMSGKDARMLTSLTSFTLENTTRGGGDKYQRCSLYRSLFQNKRWG
jgi:hypothetical protein